MATPRPGIIVRSAQETEFHHTSPAISYEGGWDRCKLHGPLTAASTTDPAARLTLQWDGDSVILFFWSHPWTSHARIVLDGEPTVLRTYSPIGGFLQRRWLDLKPGPHTVTLSPADVPDPNAQGNGGLFWKAIGLCRQ